MKKEFSDEILKGEIVIDRPLTVFTGRNGTGKTYAAKRIAGYYMPFGCYSPDNFHDYTVCPSKKPDSEYAEISQRILNELLNCQFNTFDDSYHFEWITPIGKSIRNVNPAGYAGAMIPFLIELRHKVKRGDTLILDLPETHQDPHNQVLIARFIVRLANAGLKVVLVTHSNYIIREINNLIMLSGVKEGRRAEFTEIMNKYGISPECTISPSAVRAYNFEGGEVKETGVTRDGFEVKFIDEVIDRITDETADLHYLLYDENAG